jgi:nucleotide-binding universal stress UspA family protein
MFEKMLVAIDSSPLAARVVEIAGDLARKSESSVLVVHVRDVALPVAMAAAAGRPGLVGGGGMVLEDEEAAHRLVQEAVDTLANAGVTATGRVGSGWGATAKELLDVAAEFGPDLIVIGSHGSHVRQVVLGSVAYRVIHLATCPVLVVR